MTRYFVSRHESAKELARRWQLDCEFVDHFDPEQVRVGDEVIGTLPIHVAAECVRRGASYFHLAMDIPADERLGRQQVEYSADEMLSFGARLVPYWIEPSGEPVPKKSEESSALIGPVRWIPAFVRRLEHRLERIEDRHPKPLALLYGVFLLTLCPGGVADAMVELHKQGIVAVALAIAAAGTLIAGLISFPRLFRMRSYADALARQMIRRVAQRLDKNVEDALTSGVTLVAVAGLLAIAFLLFWGLPHDSGWLAAWLAIFAGVAILAARLSTGLLGVTVEQKLPSQLETRRIVIMTLSHLSKSAPSGEAIDIAAERLKTEQHIHVRNLIRATEGKPALDLKTACDATAFESKSYFPWQQNLRVLAANFLREKGQLPGGEVIVITSKKSDGQFHEFRKMIETLGKNSALHFSVTKKGPVDYFDLGQVKESFRATIRHRIERVDNLASYGDILIDVTAGPKLVSIAGATVTMSSDLIFAYAESESVQMLDARVQFGRTPG
jgi:CRISPR-associated protein Csx16